MNGLLLRAASVDPWPLVCLCLTTTSLVLGGCGRPDEERAGGVVVVAGTAPRATAARTSISPFRTIDRPMSVIAAAPDQTFDIRPDLEAAVADDGGLRALPYELVQPRSSAVTPDRQAWAAELDRSGWRDPTG